MTNVVKSSPDCERQKKEQDFRRVSSRFFVFRRNQRLVESQPLRTTRITGVSIDHFHKWHRILLFFCIYVSYIYWPHSDLTFHLNFAQGSEARKAY